MTRNHGVPMIEAIVFVVVGVQLFCLVFGAAYWHRSQEPNTVGFDGMSDILHFYCLFWSPFTLLTGWGFTDGILSVSWLALGGFVAIQIAGFWAGVMLFRTGAWRRLRQ